MAVPYLLISDLHKKKKILFLKAGGFELGFRKLKLIFVQTQHEDGAQVRPWVSPGCSAGLALVSGAGRSWHRGRKGGREGASADRLQRNWFCRLYLVIQVVFGGNCKFPWKFTN